MNLMEGASWEQKIPMILEKQWDLRKTSPRYINLGSETLRSKERKV